MSQVSRTKNTSLGGIKATKARKSFSQDDQVKKLFEMFIDELYLKRDSVRAFQAYTAFDLWDKTDEKANNKTLFAHRLIKDVPKGLGSPTNARIAAAVWRYELQSLHLILGKYNIADSEDSLLSVPEYEEIRVSVLKTNNTDFPDFDFIGLSKSEIERKLIEAEKTFDDIDRRIFLLIDNEIYLRNIEYVKSTVKVSKTSLEGRTYFAIGIPTPNIGFLVARKRDKLKNNWFI